MVSEVMSRCTDLICCAFLRRDSAGVMQEAFGEEAGGRCSWVETFYVCAGNDALNCL